MIEKKLIFIGMTVVGGIVLSSGALLADPVAEMIEGAKKEGTVVIKLKNDYPVSSMVRLEKEIKEKFGVDLSIKFIPSAQMGKDLTEAIMEHKAGAPPSYDLMNFSNHVVEGLHEGIFAVVDWKPLITKNSNPELVIQNPAYRGALINTTAYQGLMYNPEKVPPNTAPKTFGELTNPKWKGMIGLNNGLNSWARWAVYLGKEKVLSGLRTILKNGGIKGRYVDLLNRYTLGESPICFINTNYASMARAKGMPMAWQPLEITDVSEFNVILRTGAKHPNAAKLVAVYLASPEGAKFSWEVAQNGTLYYPGNYENDVRQQNKKLGSREIFPARDEKMVKYEESAEYKRTVKELQLIFDSGGQN